MQSVAKNLYYNQSFYNNYLFEMIRKIILPIIFSILYTIYRHIIQALKGHAEKEFQSDNIFRH